MTEQNNGEAMRGIALERIRLSERAKMLDWLVSTFGPSTPTTWHLDHDYDLETLIFNEEIAVLYYLKWL